MSKIIANQLENVAGTETHNVDTMGIESGITGGLEWTKYPDGTLITSGIVTAVYFTVSQLGGKVLQTNVAINFDITGVAEFIGVPRVTGAAYSTASFAGRFFEGVSTLTTHNGILNQAVGYSGTIYAPVNVMWTAIGRWK